MPIKKLIFLSLFSFIVLLISNCSYKKEGVKSSNVDKKHYESPNFIGDEECKNCHKTEHNSWSNSHHDWAMKTPNDTNVFGDFEDKKISLDGVHYHFYKDNDEFKVRVKEKNLAEKEYSIAYTFGFYPLQQYLIKGDKGEIHTLRITWNSKDKNWYHQYKNEKIAPKDWLHWQNGGQRWNTMCADCHSTGLEKNYNLETQVFDTKYTTINVSCESCHGKASNHISWAESEDKGNPQIFTPTTQDAVMNQCAPCHSRRSKLTPFSNPWDQFSQNYLIQNLSPDFYELDGQIKEEDYVFGSFMSSKMYQEGVTCTDCHNPHSLKLKEEGNNLCLSCHEPKYNTKKHHKHQLDTDASQCVNCHMTGKDFMGHDFRRDHSFRIPRPDQSTKFGTPNACNGCHNDKKPAWAATKINDWYGPTRKAHFSDYLLTSSKNTLTETEGNQVLASILDQKLPKIARSAIVENLQNKISNQVFAELIKQINQNDYLVLNSMLNIFSQESPEIRLYVAKQHLFHPEKIIRISATKLLLDIPINQFTSSEINQLDKNDLELKKVLEFNADFPTGRLQLGDYYFQKRNLLQAKNQYIIALEMDSLLTAVYSNLATVYNLLKQNNKAISTLNTAIKLEPKNGQYEYLKGLLLHEMGDEKGAISCLNRSISKNPFLVKGYYNLAIIYFEKEDFQTALQTLKKGAKIAPESKEIQDFILLLQSKLK